jgi:hypothetical protein
MSHDAAAALDLDLADQYRMIYNYWSSRLGQEWLPPLSDSLWDIVHTKEFKDTGGGFDCQSLIPWLIWAATPENRTRPMLEGRRLAKVNDNLALVPSCAEVGDIICFFYGHSVPFVLREVAPPSLSNDIQAEIISSFKRGGKKNNVDVRSMEVSYYQYIGEGFVEGLMFGDSWPYCSRKYGNLQIFAFQ